MSDKKGVDIIHHIVDDSKLEFFNYTINLPHLELFGMDISITKHVVMMWIAAGAMLIIFPLVCNRKKSLVPTGISNLFEAMLLFVRDDIARGTIGEEDGDRFLPYLWTLFFFIFFCNLLGLIPFGATATGNISVTAALALTSFVMIHAAGIKNNGIVHYLESIVPPVPWFIWPLLLIVEVVGHIVKPVALAVRLFANMVGGHIVILVILGFIFVYPNPAVISVSVLGGCALYMLELFIALLQAYIFTFLTAVFIGIAVHAEH